MDFTTIEKRALNNVTEVEKIARFFGFCPIEPPIIQKVDFDVTKQFGDQIHLEEAALLRMYTEEKMISTPQPTMLFCNRPFKGSGLRKKSNFLEASLVSIGSSKSVCECLSIQTILAICSELGYKNLLIKINSIGDKDSVTEYTKAMNSYVKKNYNSFDSELRQALKKDPFAIVNQTKIEWKKWKEECPKSIDFLSELSRAHFKEVLEFLEIMELNYEIDNNLLGNISTGAETVFSIIHDDEQIAFGFRFNRLGKKIGFKKDIPAHIANISLKLKKNLKEVKAKSLKHDAFLVQFGPEAKMKSFLILEQLFKHNIQTIHSIAKDKLSSQINFAENSGVGYIILIGQKEALEQSVVVRNNANRAQEIVLIANLGEYMKNILKR